MRTKLLKIVLPILGLAFIIGIAFAFKAEPSGKPEKVADVPLYFKYQPSTPGDYSEASVKSRSNWQKLTAGDMCSTNDPEVACSFSIKVSETNQGLYFDGSGHPSSRVDIQTGGSTSEAYVTDITDNIPPTEPSIKDVINNKELD